MHNKGMAQRLSDSSIAKHIHKARKALFRNLKSDALRRIVNKKEQKRLNDSLLEAAQYGRTKRVERLLKLGADIEAMNNKSETAFVLAAVYGHTETCALLLEKGADIYTANIYAKNFPGWERSTAIREAKLNRRTETVKFLEFADSALKRLKGIFTDRKARVSFFLSFRACISQ